MITNFTETIGNLLKDIQDRRNEIKEEYIRAWIAAVVPDENLNLDWIIKNLSIQEQWSDDRRTVTWQLVQKAGGDE